MSAGRALVALVLVFLGASRALAQAPPAPDPKAPKAPKAEQKKPRAPGAGGLVVFVDPVTGQIREPDPSEIGSLVPPPAADAQAEDKPLAMISGPGGAVGVVLDSRFESYMVVTRTPDGKLAMDCVTGGKKADEVVAAAAKTAAKPAEKKDEPQ